MLDTKVDLKSTSFELAVTNVPSGACKFAFVRYCMHILTKKSTVII